MIKTQHLSLPLLAANQAQKELSINEALVIIDALLNNYASKININNPPANVVNGELYIIGDAPTGEWKNKVNYLAYFFNGWRFIKPNPGLDIWVSEENSLYRFIDNKWQPSK
jgi:hypothetical protein